MFVKSFVYAFLIASAAASAIVKPHRCRVDNDPDDEQKEEARVLGIQEDKEYDEGCAPYNDNIVVDTYFHIVANDKTREGGNVPDSMIKQQLAVMNQDYHQTGVQFHLKGADRTFNPTWANSDVTDADNVEMRKALRKGDYKTLNIYFQTTLGGANSGLLGYCPFPKKSRAEDPTKWYQDGCRVATETMPGGTTTNYDEGKTASHEVGHWMNLFHTFQGNSCSGPGDHIRDTPQEKTANTNGCSKPKDSCPGKAGLDPVHNFMDYSYDKCLFKFTDGQTRRIHSSWNKYRA